MAEETQNLSRSEVTETEMNELEENNDLSQGMPTNSFDIQEEKESCDHSDGAIADSSLAESTTDSIEAVSGTLVAHTQLPPEPESTSAVANRVPCKYGDQCYRVNPVHREEYSHPGDSDFNSTEDDNNDKPECRYGTSCYRTNPQHKRDFKHTQPPTQTAGPSRQKRRRKSNEEDESDGENDYDLDDPFIDDEEDEEEDDQDNEDEDYIPDSSEINQELLKEEKWKPANGDPQEVLELLEEAKNYLRNKRL